MPHSAEAALPKVIPPRVFFSLRLTNGRRMFIINKRCPFQLESCPSGRRCSTRNAVRVKPPRVRIPNSPPEKNADLDTKVSVFSLPGKPYSTRLFIVSWMQTHPALL